METESRERQPGKLPQNLCDAMQRRESRGTGFRPCSIRGRAPTCRGARGSIARGCATVRRVACVVCPAVRCPSGRAAERGESAGSLLAIHSIIHTRWLLRFGTATAPALRPSLLALRHSNLYGGVPPAA